MRPMVVHGGGKVKAAFDPVNFDWLTGGQLNLWFHGTHN